MAEAQPPAGTTGETQRTPAQEKQRKDEQQANARHEIAAIYSSARAQPLQDKPPTLDQGYYLKVYTLVHDYCVACKHRGSVASRGAHLLGEELYQFLEQQIDDHCREIIAQILDPSNHQTENPERGLIEAYMIQWSKLTQLAGLMGRLMQFLERHWIKRVRDEGNKEVFLIQDLHKRYWKLWILQVDPIASNASKGSKEILDAAVALQKRVEGGAERDQELVEQFNAALAAVNLYFKP